jgi:hypothetical protein
MKRRSQPKTEEELQKAVNVINKKIELSFRKLDHRNLPLRERKQQLETELRKIESKRERYGEIYINNIRFNIVSVEISCEGMFMALSSSLGSAKPLKGSLVEELQKVLGIDILFRKTGDN